MLYILKFRIPAELKDRRTRPHDFNNVANETIYGTLKLRTKTSEEFNEPNDPTLGIWNNFSLEDFAWYWDLPNLASAKYVYFQQIEYNELNPSEKKDRFPQLNSISDAIVQDGKEQSLYLDRPYWLAKNITWGVSSLMFYLYYLAF